MTRPLLLAAITVTSGSLAIAACGGSSGATTSAATSAPTSTAGAAAVAQSSGVQVGTTHTNLGTVLVAGPKRLTVYLFEADRHGTSSCAGACAQAWPPVTTSGQPTAASGALAGEISTIMRSDGTRQVTYNGHPLYYFIEDTASGQTNGQGVDGFGAKWYVLSPSGSTITAAPTQSSSEMATQSTPSSAAEGGYQY